MMKGFTISKDTDREILLKIEDDSTFLRTCNYSNSYILNTVCDDIFFKTRLQRTYPDTLQYKPENQTWKAYFLRVIYYIAKMKEVFDYKYQEGNPRTVYERLQKDNNDLFVDASGTGNLETVIQTLQRGADIHTENDRAILLASANGHLEIVKYLTEHGATLEARSFLSRPVFQAARAGHLEIVEYLIEHGASSHSLLENAALSGHLDIVIYLINNKLYTARDLEGSLAVSSNNGHLEIVKYLVEKGVNVSTRNNEALRRAVINRHWEIVKYLVEHGANINVDGEALRQASIQGNLDIVKYLVEKGVNIHTDNDEALRQAIHIGHQNVVNYLNSLE